MSSLSDHSRKEGNVLFNDALNTFYLRLYGVRHMVKDHWDSEDETRCRHMGYSFQLAARILLYAPSHGQDSTYHGLCYTSRGALARTRNSSMSPPHEGSIRRPIAPWANALTMELHLTPQSRSFKFPFQILQVCSYRWLGWIQCMAAWASWFKLDLGTFVNGMFLIWRRCYLHHTDHKHSVGSGRRCRNGVT